MFDNILGQEAVTHLVSDMENRFLAPAMLFAGPPASGKGSAALELGRVLSCENSAAWNCPCTACARHRLLLHPDLLCFGGRPFSAEIAAASNVLLREYANGHNPDSGSAGILFVRSVRKLLQRFSPVLWEDEPKFSKLSALAVSLEDDLDELNSFSRPEEIPEDSAGKLISSIMKDAFKLESEGIPDQIPIAWIRRASWWSRLAPSGKEKLLLIENADRMQESARNSMLKLLEEPPETVKIVLTTCRPKAMLPTVLSRLRPYRFLQRSQNTENEIIRRVFHFERSPDSADSISAWIDSFLPVSGEKLRNLAAYFSASAAYRAALLRKKRSRADPHISDLGSELVLLGQYAAPIASAAGYEKTREGSEASGLILKETGDFEIRSMFSGFNRNLLNIITESQMAKNPDSAPPHSASVTGFLELWRNCVGETEEAVMVYNQNPGLVLEHLFSKISRGMAEI